MSANRLDGKVMSAWCDGEREASLNSSSDREKTAKCIGNVIDLLETASDAVGTDEVVGSDTSNWKLLLVAESNELVLDRDIVDEMIVVWSDGSGASSIDEPSSGAHDRH